MTASVLKPDPNTKWFKRKHTECPCEKKKKKTTTFFFFFKSHYIQCQVFRRGDAQIAACSLTACSGQKETSRLGNMMPHSDTPNAQPIKANKERQQKQRIARFTREDALGGTDRGK